VRHAHRPRCSVLADADDGQRIQAVERERHEVPARQRLVAQARREPAQRAEAIAAGRCRRLARNLHPARVPHGDGLDPSRAVDEHPDAAVQRVAGLRHLPREIVREDAVGRDATPVQSLDTVPLGG